MKVWPIDPLVPRNLRLEVPEKLPQGWRDARSVVPESDPLGGVVVGHDRRCTWLWRYQHDHPGMT